MSLGPQEEKQACYHAFEEWLIANQDSVPRDHSLFSPSMQLFHIGERNLKCAELRSGKKFMWIGTIKCQIQCVWHCQDFCQSWCYFFVVVLSFFSCSLPCLSSPLTVWLHDSSTLRPLLFLGFHYFFTTLLPLQVMALFLRHWVTLHWTSRSESTRAC